MDIGAWLQSLGLEQYEPTFCDNDIEAETLLHLTPDDLVALGITSVGHRRKLLTAIAGLRSQREGSRSIPTDDAGGSSSPSSFAQGRAERRQLTVMFCDLVGSTELSQRLDPEDMREVIHDYQVTVTAEISRYEGRVAKFLGDGVLVYFGWPQAHEDDAERAVRSGLAAAAATARLRAPGGEPLASRIGIATGLVVVGDLVGEGPAQEEAVIGDTPNLAARLQGLAEANGVIIAESTQRLVSGLFEVADLGHCELKGFATPVGAWRVVGETEVESRFHASRSTATQLVGRSGELDDLLKSWQRARQGTGQAILLSGEPGIGKSRLVAALDEHLSGVEARSRLQYFCSPYHANSPLHPVVRQLQRAAGIERVDAARTKLNKLEALLLDADPNIADAGPLLAALLSIDFGRRYSPLNLAPQAQRARTLDTLTRYVAGLARRQTVMMVLEDAHWIDPTTEEWLDMVIGRLSELPLFLVVTFRPEYVPRWRKSAHVSAISLSRLEREHGAAIIDRVAGGKSLPIEVRRQILAKTEGVPLFVEELTKTVLESGFLVEAGDRYELSAPLPSLAIPSTLQDSLMARLDRFSSVKELAQTGACIGRVFHFRLLAAVTGHNQALLEAELQQLEDAELVFRSGLPPEATYAFKHALVQDTAYHSLLRSRRSQVHAAIATALEARFPDVVEAEPETLAHHHSMAGLAEQAASYWLKAGQQALKRSANVEALAHLGKGLEVAATLPSGKPRLRLAAHLWTAIGVGLMATKGWGAPEVLEAFSTARRLCQELEDNNELFVAIRGEASYHLISGNLKEADHLGVQCLEIAETSSNPDFLIEAHHQQWATKYHLGDYPAAEAHAAYGKDTYDPDRDHRLTYIYTGHDPGVCCRNYSSWMLWIRGFPDQALVRASEAVELAQRTSHVVTEVTAQSAISQVHLFRREPGKGREWAQRQFDTCVRFDAHLLAAGARFNLGWASAQEGNLVDGIEQMRRGIDAIAAAGGDMGLHFSLCVLAEALFEQGNSDAAWELVEQAFDRVERSGSKHFVPELWRTKASLLSRPRSSNDEAEACLRKAIMLARSQSARSLELRAARDLALLLQAQERRSEGRELLGPAYTWFTEGFDTHDLREAKAVLEAPSFRAV